MKLTASLLKSTIVAALGGLLFGFDTAVIAGTTSGLSHSFALNAKSLGITVAIALIGTVLGSMFAGIPGDRYGRRDSLRVMAMLYVISALGCALAWDWNSLLFFRFIGGLGIGGSSVLGPMYICRDCACQVCAAGWWAFSSSMWSSGILLAYFSNYLIGSANLGPEEWRWMLGVSAHARRPVFLHAVRHSPQSALAGRRSRGWTEARQTLRRHWRRGCRGRAAGHHRSIDAEHGHANEPLFQRKYRFPIFLAVSIGMFNQLSGINAILYYLNDIFRLGRIQQSVGRLASGVDRR